MSDKENQTISDTGIIDTCFFCYKARDAGSPSIGFHVIKSYQPCPACAEMLKNNVTLMGVSETPLFENQASIPTNRKNYFPTGRLLILTADQTADVFTHDMAQNLISTNGAMIDDRILSDIQAKIGNGIQKNNMVTNTSPDMDDIEPKNTEEELD